MVDQQSSTQTNSVVNVVNKQFSVPTVSKNSNTIPSDHIITVVQTRIYWDIDNISSYRERQLTMQFAVADDQTN